MIPEDLIPKIRNMNRKYASTARSLNTLNIKVVCFLRENYVVMLLYFDIVLVDEI